jgi:hypothetical protein
VNSPILDNEQIINEKEYELLVGQKLGVVSKGFFSENNYL